MSQKYLLPRDYLIVSSIDWTENWQMHQQLATALVESGHRVLFIENTGVRALRQGDFSRISKRIHNWLKSTRGFFDVQENLTVFSPIFIPLPYSKIALLINKLFLCRSIEKWMKIERYQSPIIISFLPTPLARELIEYINPVLAIYYCANDMAGGSKGAGRLKRYEDVFFAQVDAVFCISHTLLEYAKKINEHTFLFPAGVDFERFSAARDFGSLPDDLDVIRSPVIGYVGAISAVFDQALLVHIAHELPEATIVLIGPVVTDVSLLEGCPNIKFLGKRPHRDVPNYIKGFSVALIPYEVNAFTDAVYSCKLNEYMAMGVPVVATDMRELRCYVESNGNVLEIAKNREEFIEKIRHALVAPAEPFRSARITAAQANSWEQRFAGISGVIHQLLLAKASERLDWQSQLTSFYRRSRRKILRGSLILAACYVGLFYTPLLWFAGDILVMRDVPTSADAIVVFSGDGDPGYVSMNYQIRAQDVMALYGAKYSRSILLSSGKAQMISEAEVIRALLLGQGVPSSAISTVVQVSKSTAENVQLSVAELKKKGSKKILFVTAPYHSRRAHLTWKKLAPMLDISTVSVLDTPSREPRWNTSLEKAKVIAYEYLVITYYWYQGWI